MSEQTIAISKARSTGISGGRTPRMLRIRASTAVLSEIPETLEWDGLVWRRSGLVVSDTSMSAELRSTPLLRAGRVEIFPARSKSDIWELSVVMRPIAGSGPTLVEAYAAAMQHDWFREAVDEARREQAEQADPPTITAAGREWRLTRRNGPVKRWETRDGCYVLLNGLRHGTIGIGDTARMVSLSGFCWGSTAEAIEALAAEWDRQHGAKPVAEEPEPACCVECLQPFSAYRLHASDNYRGACCGDCSGAARESRLIPGPRIYDTHQLALSAGARWHLRHTSANASPGWEE